jgi:hypothetical protein
LNAAVRERGSNAEEVWQLNKTLSMTQSPGWDTIFELEEGKKVEQLKKKCLALGCAEPAEDMRDV